ncbi:MAG: hypothetical protein EXR06_03670 [Rickettsiales bacterium]|nr:hypothetical protein [Rickettsiales bacterium]
MLFWQIENIARAAVDAPLSPKGGVDASLVTPPEDSEDLKKQKLEAFRSKLEELAGTIYPKSHEVKNKVIEGILRNYESFPTAGRTELAKVATETLEYRAELIAKHTNVLRKKAEIKKSQLNPGVIDKSIFGEVDSRMGRGEDRWKYDRDPYGDSEVRAASSFQNKIDLIKKGTSPSIYTAPVSKENLTGMLFGSNYIELVHEAEHQTSVDLANNAHQLNSLIATGKLLPKKSASSIAIRNAANGAFDGAAHIVSKFFGAAENVSNFAGKGIWAHSDPNYNKNLLKHYQKRNLLMSDLFRNISHDRSKTADLMRRCQEILAKAEADNDGSNYGLLDAASFQELTALAKEIGKRSDEANTQKVAEFTKKINDCNDQVLESAKAETNDTDSIAKWRLLQIALMVTPFMGLSVMGPVLNVFGGVFMNSAGLGQGLASLLTAEYTGPFGYICELLHLDVAAQWLFCDMPVVSNVVSILDSAISSDVVQGVLGNMVVPLAGSVVASFALAGVAGIFHAERELELGKHGKAFKEHEKNMTKMFDDMVKEAKEAGKFNPKEFVDKKYEILKASYVKNSIVKAVAQQSEEVGMKPVISQIMGASFLKALEDYKKVDEYDDVHKVFDSADNISPKYLMDFLATHKDGAAFYDNFLLFGEAQKQVQKDNNDAYQIDVGEVLSKFAAIRPTPAAQGLIGEAKRVLAEKYMSQLAADLKIDCSDIPPYNPDATLDDKKNRTEALGKVEQAIKESEIKYFEMDPSEKRLRPPDPNVRTKDFVTLSSSQAIH